MQYIVVSSAEFTYPDLFDYPSASSAVDAFSARGTYAAWQVLLRGLDSPEADVRFEGLPEGVTPTTASRTTNESPTGPSASRRTGSTTASARSTAPSR